jgi:enoyl-CoA hydratase/carnithine racemase
MTMTMTNSKLTPPTHSDQLLLDIKEDEHILVLTMNRPKMLNAMTPTLAEDIKRVLDWFDDEPSLW